MKDVLFQLQAIWKNASGAQRAFGVLGIAVLAFGLSFAVWMSSRPDMALLFGNLDEADAGAIVDKVRQAGVAAEIRQNGRAVFVPRESIAEMRMLVSKDGVPNGGAKGFELFDQSDFGVSDFEQNVKLLRALQGELAKSIMGFDAIESAKVSISRPKRSAFASRDQKAKASVLVGLRSGRSLSRENVRAIVNLVCGAVEGLEARSVAVVDHEGRVLSDTTDDSVASQANTQFDLRQREEEYLSAKAQEQLDRIGVKADVRVACDMDFQNVRETQERYSPEDRAILSEKTESKTSKSGSGNPGGTTSANAQLQQENTLGASGETSEETEESGAAHFVPSKTLRSSEQAGARVSRLSVSLVLHKDHDAERQQIEEIVKRAVGFDESRTDSITTIVREFTAVEDPMETIDPGGSALVPMLLERGVQVLGILGALFIVLKIVKSAQSTRSTAVAASAQGGAQAAAPVPVDEESEEDIADLFKLRERVNQSVTTNPVTAARVLREWLRDGGNN